MNKLKYKFWVDEERFIIDYFVSVAMNILLDYKLIHQIYYPFHSKESPIEFIQIYTEILKRYCHIYDENYNLISTPKG